ncbi:hypothetical protein NFJ02_30g76520 [Pycnococcus provasolii]
MREVLGKRREVLKGIQRLHEVHRCGLGSANARHLEVGHRRGLEHAMEGSIREEVNLLGRHRAIVVCEMQLCACATACMNARDADTFAGTCPAASATLGATSVRLARMRWAIAVASR